jgi:hypothetical protein
VRQGKVLLAAPLAIVLAACGGSDYQNKPRPPAPINVTAAIDAKSVRVSPGSFGAGPIVIIISNQSGAVQRLTFASDELGAAHGGIKQSSEMIEPRSTGQLKIDPREGSYTLSARAAGVAPAKLTVGGQRRSSQNDLLLP